MHLKDVKGLGVAVRVLGVIVRVLGSAVGVLGRGVKSSNCTVQYFISDFGYCCKGFGQFC